MAKGNGRLPDFIIGGAMKSATTSLHYLLAQHPRIFIPEGEVNFFSLDDTDENRPYLCHGDRIVYDIDGERERYLAWYRGHFDAAGPEQMIGEDSTVYLPSTTSRPADRRADPGRQADLPAARPDRARLLALLAPGRARPGDLPVRPHAAVGAGSADGAQLLRRQLEVYYDLFPRENILVMLFEEFVKDIEGHTQRAVEFLGLPPMESIDRADSKRNMGSRPVSIRLRLLHNRLLRHGRIQHYPAGVPPLDGCHTGLWPRIADATHRALNRFTLSKRRYPAMKEDTRQFLEVLFEQENRGLAKLIGRELEPFWPYMNE